MAVKIVLKDLMAMADEKTYPVQFDVYEVKNNVFLRRLENVDGQIVFYYDLSDKLRVTYQIAGEMICPDAITLEDVSVPFEVDEDEAVVFDPKEEGFLLDTNRESEEVVLSVVLSEVPIKVVKNRKIEYSRGDGWSFVSEKDYEASKKDEIDPRLQILKEYRFEEDD